MARNPSPSFADRLAELVDKLLGRSVRPQPAYVPATVRRPVPVRIRTDRR